MKVKTVIHIIGATSSRNHCLDELKKEVGGVPLIFSYDNFVKFDREELEAKCLKWIQTQVKDNNLILTYGLPVRTAKAWIKKAYPKTDFKHLIWEVHHNKLGEEKIVRERSWTFLLNGILTQGKTALRNNLQGNHDLIKYTPLRLAIEYLKKNKDDLNGFIRSLVKQQVQENTVHRRGALICSEAFDPVIRKKSITEISRLVTTGKNL